MKPIDFLAAIVAIALLAAATTPIVSSLAETPHEDGALCTTDTDCQRFCPPPADDPECDGGPQ